ncbi:hypothetical protein KVT40_009238 [Elsinoe batatas]|uniref:Uncharacterized protein n=1 Tax=Elsinoe batatas TaxID=2601811 RepID=A0A8K0PB19_9PEZI|nr:hypothetical protein KVT40_009238 [Elsinoe batatas]
MARGRYSLLRYRDLARAPDVSNAIESDLHKLSETDADLTWERVLQSLSNRFLSSSSFNNPLDALLLVKAKQLGHYNTLRSRGVICDAVHEAWVTAAGGSSPAPVHNISDPSSKLGSMLTEDKGLSSDCSDPEESDSGDSESQDSQTKSDSEDVQPEDSDPHDLGSEGAGSEHSVADLGPDIPHQAPSRKKGPDQKGQKAVRVTAQNQPSENPLLARIKSRETWSEFPAGIPNKILPKAWNATNRTAPFCKAILNSFHTIACSLTLTQANERFLEATDKGRNRLTGVILSRLAAELKAEPITIDLASGAASLSQQILFSAGDVRDSPIPEVQGSQSDESEDLVSEAQTGKQSADTQPEAQPRTPAPRRQVSKKQRRLIRFPSSRSASRFGRKQTFSEEQTDKSSTPNAEQSQTHLSEGQINLARSPEAVRGTSSPGEDQTDYSAPSPEVGRGYANQAEDQIGSCISDTLGDLLDTSCIQLPRISVGRSIRDTSIESPHSRDTRNLPFTPGMTDIDDSYIAQSIEGDNGAGDSSPTQTGDQRHTTVDSVLQPREDRCTEQHSTKRKTASSMGTHERTHKKARSASGLSKSSYIQSEDQSEVELLRHPQVKSFLRSLTMEPATRDIARINGTFRDTPASMASARSRHTASRPEVPDQPDSLTHNPWRPRSAIGTTHDPTTAPYSTQPSLLARAPTRLQSSGPSEALIRDPLLTPIKRCLEGIASTRRDRQALAALCDSIQDTKTRLNAEVRHQINAAQEFIESLQPIINEFRTLAASNSATFYHTELQRYQGMVGEKNGEIASLKLEEADMLEKISQDESQLQEARSMERKEAEFLSQVLVLARMAHDIADDSWDFQALRSTQFALNLPKAVLDLFQVALDLSQVAFKPSQVTLYHSRVVHKVSQVVADPCLLAVRLVPVSPTRIGPSPT